MLGALVLCMEGAPGNGKHEGGGQQQRTNAEGRSEGEHHGEGEDPGVLICTSGKPSMSNQTISVTPCR